MKNKFIIYCLPLLITYLSKICLSLPVEDLVDKLFGDIYKNKIYSGYLKTENQNRKLHYIFLESQSDPKKDPVVLWLNGGPGCSSLLGFIKENGPVLIPDGKAQFELNKYSWNKKANMIYLESPAGVGFSYNDNSKEDLKYNDQKVANDNALALLDFFESKFPELRKNHFYITGESYAGVYIPTLAENILKNFSNEINLKGILIGNGVTDLEVDIEKALVDFGLGHGLYPQSLYDSYYLNCNSTQADDETPQCIQAKKDIKSTLQGLNIYDIYRECPKEDKFQFIEEQEILKANPQFFSDKLIEFSSNNLKEVMNQQHATINMLNKISQKQRIEKAFFRNTNLNSTDKINSSQISFLRESNPDIVDIELKNNSNKLPDIKYFEIWPDACAGDKFPAQFFNAAETKMKLNVRQNITFTQCNYEIMANYIFGDSINSYKNFLLNSGLRIWIFAGDIDAAVPFTGTIKWIQKLNLDITEKYRKWVVKGQTAGYVQAYESLVYITVRGAGHMVPQWKNEESFVLFDAFLKGERLPLN